MIVLIECMKIIMQSENVDKAEGQMATMLVTRSAAEKNSKYPIKYTHASYLVNSWCSQRYQAMPILSDLLTLSGSYILTLPVSNPWSSLIPLNTVSPLLVANHLFHHSALCLRHSFLIISFTLHSCVSVTRPWSSLLQSRECIRHSSQITFHSSLQCFNPSSLIISL